MKTREERKQLKAARVAARSVRVLTQVAEQNALFAMREAEEKARRGQNVTVTNGFTLGFTIFWGFALGSLVLGLIILVLNLAGCGLLLGLLQ